ncbi:branched-chain amino acid transport system ATP-binding protein [Spirochaetota bacterium]|nr:branched-chain amino acid transport system ATP-binding protein [Spirochaetota bacterium]
MSPNSTQPSSPRRKKSSIQAASNKSRKQTKSSAQSVKRATPTHHALRTKKSSSRITGYGEGSVSTVLSVDKVTAEVGKIATQGPTIKKLQSLTTQLLPKRSKSSATTKAQKNRSTYQAEQKPPTSTKSSAAHYLTFTGVTAGYGNMTILTDFNLYLEKGQSLCLIGPNGAGKSTVLHTLYGLTRITAGKMTLDGKDITALPPNEKLRQVKIAYLLQENSVFPDMTIEENLLMGGFLKPNQDEARTAMEQVLSKYDRLKARRNQKASVLSGGERRLLEISRALIMSPEVLLIDEPSIGLEPRFIDMVFDILKDLRDNEKKTILMVEQNAKKGLEFADLAYVLASGKTVLAGTGAELIKNPRVGQLFLGG